MKLQTSSILFCSVCEHDGFNDIPAEFYCETCHQYLCLKDSRIHRKELPQHLMRKLNDDQKSPIQASPQSCQLHQCPINTFCKTCRQIICSSCSVSPLHKSHDCYLLSEIDQEMRQEVQKDIDKLQELTTNWELKSHSGYASLDQEMAEIEKQRQVLKKEMDTVFDELHQSLRKRHETLNEELDKLCQRELASFQKLKN
ncbi:hypothetical protein C9374_004736 [Naegleria lovaniensis]|uniref:B box-type domain-containing protein n=1 Tax=Naegleria lovaniensis TaxID=51637 RepID=A0AA88GKT4_NAELO|nr:uncharacterized protein C9374_004736 [Naegleria lovaniensis]KAG2382769.1 hypothetical protein C9374_004736 [Naegleria lovaniensis]